ncbi:hypothetical protein HE1_01169 [Holospora elegans E1]|nr:hypothetical protein HE1_01169 [Holospora elegans E1]
MREIQGNIADSFFNEKLFSLKSVGPSLLKNYKDIDSDVDYVKKRLNHVYSVLIGAKNFLSGIVENSEKLPQEVLKSITFEETKKFKESFVADLKKAIGSTDVTRSLVKYPTEEELNKAIASGVYPSEEEFKEATELSKQKVVDFSKFEEIFSETVKTRIFSLGSQSLKGRNSSDRKTTQNFAPEDSSSKNPSPFDTQKPFRFKTAGYPNASSGSFSPFNTQPLPRFKTVSNFGTLKPSFNAPAQFNTGSKQNFNMNSNPIKPLVSSLIKNIDRFIPQIKAYEGMNEVAQFVSRVSDQVLLGNKSNQAKAPDLSEYQKSEDVAKILNHQIQSLKVSFEDLKKFILKKQRNFENDKHHTASSFLNFIAPEFKSELKNGSITFSSEKFNLLKKQIFEVLFCVCTNSVQQLSDPIIKDNKGNAQQSLDVFGKASDCLDDWNSHSGEGEGSKITFDQYLFDYTSESQRKQLVDLVEEIQKITMSALEK